MTTKFNHDTIERVQVGMKDEFGRFDNSLEALIKENEGTFLFTEKEKVPCGNACGMTTVEYAYFLKK